MPTFDVSVCVEMLFADEPMEERIARSAAGGADAVEFWGYEEKDLDAVDAACEEHGVSVAGMVGAGVPLTDPERTAEAAESMEGAIATAEAHDVPTLIVTVGQDHRDYRRETQFEAVVEALERVAPVAERAGVTLVVEPLNTRVDHPGYFLTRSGEAFELVRRVDSPSVKVLFDAYHQQISEGDVTRRLTDHLDLVGHVHVADNPGRNEPGTGELDHANLFAALEEAGYDRHVGLEYRPSEGVDDDEALAAAMERLP